MQISSVAQENPVVQSSVVAARQEQRPAQERSEQQVQASPKDSVNLSEAARVLAAQLTGGAAAPEEGREAPQVAEKRVEPANPST